MKKSELTNSIKEEIFKILSEETSDFISHVESVNEGKEWSPSEQKMANQITRYKKEGLNIFRLPMKTQEFYRKHQDKFEESVNESLNPEVSRDVNRYIARTAKRYGYSEQDAVYAIMAALKQRDFDGVNEAEDMDDVEMDKKAAKAAKKGDSISKIANKLRETDSQMKSVVKKWKDSEEPEKSKLLTRLKELTKIKKELEGLL